MARFIHITNEGNRPFGERVFSGLLVVVLMLQLAVPYAHAVEEGSPLGLERADAPLPPDLGSVETDVPASERDRSEAEDISSVGEVPNEVVQQPAGDISDENDGGEILENEPGVETETDEESVAIVSDTGAEGEKKEDGPKEIVEPSDNTLFEESNAAQPITTDDAPIDDSMGLSEGRETHEDSGNSETIEAVPDHVSADGTDFAEASTESIGEGSSIATGDAVSVANIVNVVNTTIFNSSGALLFLNNLLQQFGPAVDLRDIFLNAIPGRVSTTTSLCGLEQCNDQGVDLHLRSSSTASIVNDIVVRSHTGGNTVMNASGDASVQTGDAVASANVVNVLNTNITESQYLLVSLSNFGDLLGDIVLPGKAFFEELFFGGDASSTPRMHVSAEHENDAILDTALDTVADTGGNMASSTDVSIETGDSNAHGAVANHINKNLFNSDSLIMLFRIYGKWNGGIIGAPEGLAWRESEHGVEIWNEQDSESADIPQVGGVAASSTEKQSVDARVKNNARISNNIQVVALTGENYAEGEDTAHIATGNATAGASVVNIANTNIFGSNFILAIFNIFGDWEGNIAFGRPDLWVGSRVETPRNPIEKGDRLTYHFTVANRGDADAHNVRLKTAFPDGLLAFDSGSTDERGVSWNIGTIPKGEVVEFAYGATVGTLPYGDSVLESTISVASDGGDALVEDNTEMITIGGWNEPPGFAMRGPHIKYTPDPELLIVKTNSATGTLSASSTVDYTITIENAGEGPAYHAVLEDHIESQDGMTIYESEWPLDTIAPGEQITVNYTVVYNEATPPGTYVNYAQVKAIGRHPSEDPFYGARADSSIASSGILIAADDTIAEDYARDEARGVGGIGDLALFADTDMSQRGSGTTTSTSTTAISEDHQAVLEYTNGHMGAATSTASGAVRTQTAAIDLAKNITDFMLGPVRPETVHAAPTAPADRVRDDQVAANALAGAVAAGPFWIAGAVLAIALYISYRFRFFG